MASRDTPYATELKTAILAFSEGSEARLERLFIKDSGTEAIRFSWWKDNRMMMRPLDLSEEDLLTLLLDAMAQEVLSADFLAKLSGKA